MQRQRSLFEVLPPTAAQASYTPVFPSLDGITDVIIDFETTGLRWWNNDRAVGLAVGFRDGRSYYLPWGHSGGNVPEEKALAWARKELRGKHLIAHNAQFDIQVGYKWGVDFEAMGCTVSDTSHLGALLDDHRRSFSLDNLAKDLLGYGKIEGLDKKRLADYHASDVAAYAQRDVVLTNELYERFVQGISDEGLDRVRALEEACVWVTCEMMRNGSPMDEEKLNAWLKRSERDYYNALWDLFKHGGMNVNPASHPDCEALFRKLQIPPPINDAPGPDQGKVTFVQSKLKVYDHPAIKALYNAKRLGSLRSKYLLKYAKELAKNGIIRYSLHQLPADDDGGTVSGRFSSSGFGTEEDDGCNIQQVAGKKHAANMKAEALKGYAIRELFIPGSGMWLSADAAQIEYRLFAHYAKPPRVMEAYAQNQWTDFHNIVMEMIKLVLPTITRETTKDCNFAKIYGAQVKKLAIMLGVTQEQAKQFSNSYNEVFPEAEKLLRYATNLAETRGYVRTILGRRARFKPGERTYAALNRVIQGSAADEMKTKLVALHRERKRTGFKLRFTVHDEVNGDVPNVESAKEVQKILNTQMLPTCVPLLWEVGVGPNWQECQKLEKMAA